MKIVVISLRSDDHAPEEFEPYLAAEAKTVLGFMADDFVRELYSIPEGRGAVAIVEAASEAEAREKFATLPLAKAGLGAHPDKPRHRNDEAQRQDEGAAEGDRPAGK